MESENKAIKFFSSLTDRAHIFDFDIGHTAVFSYPSSNQAEDNQDSAALIPLNKDEIVLVLSDGAGGQPGGQSASQTVINSLENELLHHSNKDQLIRASVLNAIESANKKIIETKSGAGATACVVTIEENMIRPFHIGDSVIAVIGQKGKLIYRNTEHSPLGYAIRSELIEEKHLDTEVSHEVFNLVGNADMHIEIGPEIELKKFDTLFICSDGISDFISLDECLEIIQSGKLADAAGQLIENYFKTVENADYKDDATFILYRGDG